MSLTAIILAAGKGTRMKSDKPKGLHPVCGIPIVELIVRAAIEAGAEKPIVVVGHGGDQVVKALGDRCDYAWQHDPQGTGHAAQQTLPFLEDLEGAVIVAPGDTPLLDADVFSRLASVHGQNRNHCTIATAILPDATGYGRVIRDPQTGLATAIVEHKDSTDEQRAVREVNSAVYCFDVKTLRELLPQLSNDNVQGEFYLTDVIKMIVERGGRCEALPFDDDAILVGVNDRWQLALAAKELRVRILRKHALNGVSIVDPDSTYIEPDVLIGPDTIIEPGTIIEGRTVIGRNCVIGPNTKVQNSSVGDECLVLMSHLSRATLLTGARCGPFANLRPGAVLGPRVKVGNFVEVKNAVLEEGVAVSHLSYIGDGSVGADTNIGAGTIFCNYDGFAKHRTEIGSGAFIGSNSTLVAPVTIGNGAMIAAGSVITRDVPDQALAVGRSRQETKEEWAQRWRTSKMAAQTGTE